jgi:hypothetical protein
LLLIGYSTVQPSNRIKETNSMDRTKTVMIALDVIPCVKLEAAAKKNKKSIIDFIVSFFAKKVHCTASTHKKACA